MASTTGYYWSVIGATALSGIATGALTFVSAVDVRSFLTHLDSDDDGTNKKVEDGQDTDGTTTSNNSISKISLIQQHFPIWWPYGRDLMVPVIVASLATNAIAYYQTKDWRFVGTGLLVGFLGPYTGIVLGEDIETLRNAQPSQVEETTRRFCRLHHIRLVAAATGFGLALTALADL